MTTIVERARLTIALPVEMQRRLRLVAAQLDVLVPQYALRTIKDQLEKDWVKLARQKGLLALTAQADPVLAELWDNEKDAAYDRL